MIASIYSVIVSSSFAADRETSRHRLLFTTAATTDFLASHALLPPQVPALESTKHAVHQYPQRPTCAGDRRRGALRPGYAGDVRDRRLQLSPRSHRRCNP